MILFKVSRDRDLWPMQNGMPVTIHTIADNGLRMQFVHADSDGYISVPVDKDALIVCCHPKRVRARYPHLKVAGTWDGGTTSHYHGPTATYYVLPTSQVAQLDAHLAKLNARLEIVQQ